MLWNMLEMSGGSILVYALLDARGFALTCAGGLVLAATLWWLCRFVAAHWNRSYRLLPLQHLLCALGAVCTLLLCIAFISVGTVDGYFDDLVDKWAATEARPAGDTTQAPPLTEEQFKEQYPFAHAVLSQGSPGEDTATVVDSHPPASTRALNEITQMLKDQFKDHVDWAVFRLRLFLAATFLAIQACVFGIIAFSAHRDIRPAL